MANPASFNITDLALDAYITQPAVQTIDTNGTVPIAAGGMTDHLFIEVINTDDAALTVTVKAGDYPPAARAGIGDLAVAMAASGTATDKRIIGPLESARFAQDDGSINVLNRCRKPDGTIDDARGRAKIVDPSGAKLKVSFFGPFYGDYWVLDHADNYSWSIVGEPSGRYLWLLAREPTPPEANVNKLIARARDMGYDTSLLLRTVQP